MMIDYAGCRNEMEVERRRDETRHDGDETMRRGQTWNLQFCGKMAASKEDETRGARLIDANSLFQSPNSGLMQ